jgi:hypothetical protein
VAAPLARVTLARNGKATAVIVLADSPSEAARLAAADLQRYLKRITGADFAVQPESALARHAGAAIVIGATRLSAAAGIDPAKLAPEGYRMLTASGKLFLVGADRNARDRGSFYAVCALLEDLGVRWLWPGELGTILPRKDTLTVMPVDRTAAPAMHLRQFRDSIDNMGAGRLPKGMDYFGMDRTRHAAMVEESREWTAHQRIGSNATANYGHAFGAWWQKYHETHPEYFAMMPDGSRQWPWTNYDRVKLCISNPRVLEQWWEEARAFLKNNPDALSVSATPNDNAYDGHCTCAACEKWDPAEGEVYQMTWKSGGQQVVKPHVALSDRYFHFYNLAAGKLAREFPDKMVGRTLIAPGAIRRCASATSARTFWWGTWATIKSVFRKRLSRRSAPTGTNGAD